MVHVVVCLAWLEATLISAETDTCQAHSQSSSTAFIFQSFIFACRVYHNSHDKITSQSSDVGGFGTDVWLGTISLRTHNLPVSAALLTLFFLLLLAYLFGLTSVILLLMSE
jgi:hypothetical protein